MTNKEWLLSKATKDEIDEIAPGLLGMSKEKFTDWLGSERRKTVKKRIRDLKGAENIRFLHDESKKDTCEKCGILEGKEYHCPCIWCAKKSLIVAALSEDEGTDRYIKDEFLDKEIMVEELE